MKPQLDTTQSAICALTGAMVTDLLTTHLRRLEDNAIETSEATGKAPSVKATFSVSFNPRQSAPAVKVKIRSTTALADEAEDHADPKQLKISGVITDADNTAAHRG
jgi:hypothetical protein